MVCIRIPNFNEWLSWCKLYRSLNYFVQFWMPNIYACNGHVLGMLLTCWEVYWSRRSSIGETLCNLFLKGMSQPNDYLVNYNHFCTTRNLTTLYKCWSCGHQGWRLSPYYSFRSILQSDASCMLRHHAWAWIIIINIIYLFHRLLWFRFTSRLYFHFHGGQWWKRHRP